VTNVRRVFYDTEFIDDGRTIRLISIGMVDEEGKTYYAVVNDLDVMRDAMMHPWLPDNVMCHLPGRPDQRSAQAWMWDRAHKDFGNVKPRAQIAADVASFLLEPGMPLASVELWAWFAAYDHVALAQLFGPMSGLPTGIPMFTHELRQRWEESGHPDLPAQHSAHNALTDAYWDRAVWMRCETARMDAYARRAGMGQWRRDAARS
jgi:hypothetical protein